MDLNLNGKHILITGGSKGIGRRCADYFAADGAHVAFCARDQKGVDEASAALKAKGVDEVWCLATNDAFVMAAWGRDQKAAGKVRMLADGSVNFTKALGLELDLTARGMGVRTNRFAMIVDNGVVKHIAVEAAGKFEVSSAEAILAKL